MTQVMRPGEVIAGGGKDGLQCLLNCLLCVESHNRVCDVGVRRELLDGVSVLLGLAQEELRLFEIRLGQERGPRAMHERTRNSLAPSGLLLGDDDDIDWNSKRWEGIAQTDHLAQLAVLMLLD